jgi:hypothetical protein
MLWTLRDEKHLLFDPSTQKVGGLHELIEFFYKILYVHCPKTHEQFPNSFGNAELISSDRRKLFINIF